MLAALNRDSADNLICEETLVQSLRVSCAKHRGGLTLGHSLTSFDVHTWPLCSYPERHHSGTEGSVGSRATLLPESRPRLLHCLKVGLSLHFPFAFPPL